MTDFNTWLKEQREIESKATPGPWPAMFCRMRLTWPDQRRYDTVTATGPNHKEEDISMASRDSDMIVESRNNYRNMLDALEIAVKALSTITLTENDAADVYVNYRRDVTLKQIKEKLGVK